MATVNKVVRGLAAAVLWHGRGTGRPGDRAYWARCRVGDVADLLGGEGRAC